MGYQFTENADGTLTLRDFILMAPLSAGEKGSRGVDASWFESAVQKHKTEKHPVYLFHGHNEIDPKTKSVTRYAPIVGRAEPDSLYFDGQHLRAAEVKVTHPYYIDAFKRKAVGRQSAEFYESSRRILGTAFLGGIPGHQDKHIPEPTLEGLSAHHKDELARLTASESISLSNTEHVAMTPEEIKKLVQDTVTEAIKASVPEAIRTLKAENADPFGEGLNSLLEKKIAERDKANSLKACKDRHVLILSTRHNALWDENALRAHFDKCETEREIVSEFKRLNAINTKAEAQVAMGEEESLQTPDFKLRKEAEAAWEKDKAKWEALNYTRESFIKSYADLDLAKA